MNTTSNFQLTKEQSRCFDLVKGLAILLVIFIHVDIRTKAHTIQYSAFDIYMQALTRVVVFNAVPMFFFISGYLFFLKFNGFKKKWASRFRTLVVPYIVWCLWGFFLPFFFQRVLGLEHLFDGGKLKHIAEFEPMDYIYMFWNIREGAPILSTLWFLRDLIVMIAITPIFYFLARIIDWLLPLGLLAIYLFVKIPVDGISGTALFFFGTGSWMAIKHAGGVKFLFQTSPMKIIIPVWIVVFICVMQAYLINVDYYGIILGIFHIVNSLLMFRLIGKLSVKYELKWLFAMAGASFFIYLFHEPWLGYLIGILFKALHPSGLILWILPWILVTAAVCYSYFVYLILNKYAPRLLSFITGSRV